MEMELKGVKAQTLLNGMRVLLVEQWLTLDDGTGIRAVHTFPEDALEWRAAEYGIDPADTETLLDIVLWEPHLPEPDKPELTLYDAPDTKTAREYHLARVAAMKGKQKKPQAPGRPDPVRGQIVALSRMNPNALEVKKVLVDEGRKARGKERAELARMAAEQGAEAARVERLKAVLERPRGQQPGQNPVQGKGRN